jgi:hypothetical protein
LGDIVIVWEIYGRYKKAFWGAIDFLGEECQACAFRSWLHWGEVLGAIDFVLAGQALAIFFANFPNGSLTYKFRVGLRFGGSLGDIGISWELYGRYKKSFWGAIDFLAEGCQAYGFRSWLHSGEVLGAMDFVLAGQALAIKVF